ncbi:MAG: hypothetical protein FD160_3767 [Caulobacteraceae bacterium]|nr:MAG: hypothetical protein FD160_3767 [Caulobacteraceae bacterium]
MIDAKTLADVRVTPDDAQRAFRKVGEKHDANKLRFDLVPPGTLGPIVQVLAYGAKKYTENGWMEVPDARRRYYAATIRHLTAWWEGEELDPESGLPHLAHAGANLMFLLGAPR